MPKNNKPGQLARGSPAASAEAVEIRSPAESDLADRASRRLAAIVESSDDAIIAKDLKSIVTDWNAAAERIFGYTAEEMIGNSIMRLIPPERQMEEQEILARIRRGERFQHFETVRITKDHRRLQVSLTISPIKNAAGTVVGASKIARDITERKLAEEALNKARQEAEAANAERQHLLERERAAREEAEASNRMKDEFLTTLSHELRTPLNAILGWSNVLRTNLPADGDLAQGLETIERNARAQAQIIDDLLDMSQIISGKVRLEVQRFDLAAVLADSIETIRTAADAKGVILTVSVEALNAEVTGDPNRLRQVFWNLLNNAIKFTPKDGRIQVLLERTDTHLRISVMDTGEGISRKFLPFVFNRFQQADATPTRRHGGLGLGLAIVKQLVELHGGQVRASSEGIGKGSAFVVELPLMVAWSESPESAPLPPEEAPHDLQPLPAVSLEGVRVLVVDDEADARNLVGRLLELSGASVFQARSAREGMETLLREDIEVLICDIGMPEEDGYSLIRRVRCLEDSRRSGIAAAALTAYARLEDRTKAIGAGFQDHLTKPVEPAELLAAVRRLADSRSKPAPVARKDNR